MDSILLLFICLLLGIFFKKKKLLPANAHLVLNQFILNVSLPAMALYYLPKIKLSWQLLYPLSVAWIAFGLAFILFNIIGKWAGWSKKLIGCLILTAGLGNTSFVGIPVIQALYGEEGLKTLVIVDLPGTFMVLSTLGILVATQYANSHASWKSKLFKILQFPPFLAFLIGTGMMLMQWEFPQLLTDVFAKLMLTISPIALISVGFQLKIQKDSQHWPYLAMGLAYQLVLLPAIIFVLFVIIGGQSGIPIQVSIMEAAMAPMITAAIVAANYGLKPQLSAMMVGIGIPLSFITLALWYVFLAWYFNMPLFFQ
jgi:predicted permease